jgi:putative hydrolase of the HAD superfamily
MTEYGIEADAFLEYVHDIDHSVLEPDPELGEAIRRLPGRRYIMTNGTRAHATKTADRLGITQHFDDIFDIVAADLIPKPDQSAYATFFALHGIAPERAAMFEDLSRNLIVPHSVGMRTVLVLPPGELPLFRQTWELEGAGDAHVDFATDDLTDFLTKALASID